MNDKKWLVWSNEHKAWWGNNGSGYTHSRKNAGRYTQEEAEEVCFHANNYLTDTNHPNETMVPE